MRKPVCSIAMLLLSLACLSACGQKGPLFLPGDPSQIQTIPPAERDQTNTDDDEDEEKPITNRN